MISPRPADAFDVAVIGYGPTGATLAGLLGRLGLTVLVIERATAIHELPRAAGFDHDAMRIFQRLGVTDALAPHVQPYRSSEYRGADDQVILRFRQLAPPWPQGWRPNYTFGQPALEAVLRSAVEAMPGATVRLGHELVDVVDAGDGVTLDTRDGAGAAHRFTARYVVGCDGASSFVRRHLDFALDSLDYDEPWVVVDLLVNPEALARLPDVNIQYCRPERPCTHVVCPGNHRRWEFMTIEGEPREGPVDDARLWRMLAPWLAPGDAEIWRAAAYTFHALVARDWRRGRVFLAGDAAHMTPPFMAQGMCQGLRDAANLAWKLHLVVTGAAPDALLDTYTAERRPHVVQVTTKTKELGAIISERDPAKARERDRRMLAAGDPQPTVRNNLIPPLVAGLIAAEAPLAGTPFPQPHVTLDDGRRLLLDDVTGPVPHVVLLGDRVAPRDIAHVAARGRALGFTVVLADTPEVVRHVVPPGVIRVRDDDWLLPKLVGDADCIGAIVRPDHYVYAGLATIEEAIPLAERCAGAIFRQTSRRVTT